MALLPPPQKRNRALLPPGRVYYSDLPYYSGWSASTIKRLLRPRDEAARRAWAERLDIRQLPTGRTVLLHCDAARVEAWIQEEQAAARGGPLAIHLSPPPCPRCGARVQRAEAGRCPLCPVTAA